MEMVTQITDKLRLQTLEEISAAANLPVRANPSLEIFKTWDYVDCIIHRLPDYGKLQTIPSAFCNDCFIFVDRYDMSS